MCEDFTDNNIPSRDEAIENIHIQGTKEFPLFSFQNDFSISAMTTATLWHWHHEMQLCVITDGAFRFHIDSEIIELACGDGLFVNPEYIHKFDKASDLPCKYICVDFHPKLLQSFLGSSIGKYINDFISNQSIKALHLSPSIPWQNTIISCTHKIYDLYTQKASCYELLICSSLFLAIGTLLQNTQENISPTSMTSPSTRERKLKKIIFFIDSNYTKPISLEDIATAVSISESECCRLFKQLLNCTITEYIGDCRIRYSANLLLSTNLSVKEIALKSGFSGTSYFIRQFRSKLSCTPKEYRNKNGFS